MVELRDQNSGAGMASCGTHRGRWGQRCSITVGSSKSRRIGMLAVADCKDNRRREGVRLGGLRCAAPHLPSLA